VKKNVLHQPIVVFLLNLEVLNSYQVLNFLLIIRSFFTPGKNSRKILIHIQVVGFYFHLGFAKSLSLSLPRQAVKRQRLYSL